jgi:pimeloyl-ACP methyl ester carboxylesterase
MNKIILLLALLFTNLCFAQYQNSYRNIAYDFQPGVNSRYLSLDIYRQTNGENLPVIFFVHGGGWSSGDKASRSHDNKRNFFINNGFLFVSVNYRLTPDVMYPQHSLDIAKAFTFILENISSYGGDKKQIFVMGHSAGAHLAALLSSDKSFLNNSGYGLENIQGVILLDGAGYNIPWVINDNINNNNQSGLNMYYSAFGFDLPIWELASPITHINAIDTIPPFQIFHVDTRRLSTIVSNQLFDAINGNNQFTEIIPVANSSHAMINKNFGLESDVVSQQALVFIQSIREELFERVFSNNFD